MTIRNIDKFVASIQDWAILDGCFGQTRIRPSDIDGFVERRGVCLFLEGKGHDVPLTTGQAIAFSTLAKQGNTVIVFWGKDRDISKMRVITKSDPGTVRLCSLEDLRSAVKAWYEAANRPKVNSAAPPSRSQPQPPKSALPDWVNEL